MSADVALIRRAAALMRERAELMAPTPWEVNHIDPAVCGGGIDRWFVMSDPHGFNIGPLSIHEWEPTAHYAASWHPAVALAVAAWLDVTASTPGFDIFAGGRKSHVSANIAAALAVARAYLGASA